MTKGLIGNCFALSGKGDFRILHIIFERHVLISTYIVSEDKIDYVLAGLTFVAKSI